MRAIHLFPDIGTSEAVSEFRAAHDPLALKISPHITLVFPFKSEISDDLLISHVRLVTEAIEPFPITLGKAEFHSPDYIWLPVLKGTENIHFLHIQLYLGPLAHFKNPAQEYKPHITIGRVSRQLGENLSKAESINISAEIRIDNVVIERINSEGLSEILHTFALNSIKAK